jgi:hypothetical protein
VRGLERELLEDLHHGLLATGWRLARSQRTLRVGPS